MDDFSQSKFSLPLLEEFSDDEKPILSMSYDRFTKWLFSRQFFARAFFERFLPERVLNEIDLDSLELMTSQYVNSEGKTSLSDVCYQVKQKKGGRKTFVILLEHKSNADRGAALQMARYDLDLLDLMFQNPELYADAERQDTVALSDFVLSGGLSRFRRNRLAPISRRPIRYVV